MALFISEPLSGVALAEVQAFGVQIGMELEKLAAEILGLEENERGQEVYGGWRACWADREGLPPRIESVTRRCVPKYWAQPKQMVDWEVVSLDEEDEETGEKLVQLRRWEREMWGTVRFSEEMQELEFASENTPRCVGKAVEKVVSLPEGSHEPLWPLLRRGVQLEQASQMIWQPLGDKPPVKKHRVRKFLGKLRAKLSCV